MAFITSYCRIKDFNLIKDGQELFKTEGGNLEHFLDESYSAIGLDYPKYFKMDRLCRLGILASELVFNPVKSQYTETQLGVILSNSTSSLDTDFRFNDSTKAIASPALFVYTLPNIVIGEICIRNNIKGDNEFFIFDTFDSDFMESYVETILKEGSVDACLAGWVDCLQDYHDVLFYFVESTGEPNSLPHTRENLKTLYKYGRTDGHT